MRIVSSAVFFFFRAGEAIGNEQSAAKAKAGAPQGEIFGINLG